jgi:tryptophanyl-tRNA synthetase
VQGIFSSVGRLPAPDGKSKMSKSLGNVINFDMPDSIIKKFVNSMYPGIDARKIDEPGVVDGNVIITYLKAFDPNTEQLDELIKAYQLGGIGDSELKKRLYDVLLDFITPIRDKRTKLSDTFIADVLYEGTCAGKARVGEVLGAVERDMGIKYDESIFKGLKKE